MLKVLSETFLTWKTQLCGPEVTRMSPKSWTVRSNSAMPSTTVPFFVEAGANGFRFFVRELHHVLAVDITYFEEGQSVSFEAGDLSFEAIIRFVCKCA